MIIEVSEVKNESGLIGYNIARENQSIEFASVTNEIIDDMEIQNEVAIYLANGGIIIELNPMSAEERIKNKIINFEKLIQGHLDQSAQKRGYDNIFTAVSYAGSPDTTFNNEGVMFRNWRSAVWVYVNTERVKFEAGTRTIPSDDDLIAELPLLVTYQ